jgi:hypothetical protein
MYQYLDKMNTDTKKLFSKEVLNSGIEPSFFDIVNSIKLFYNCENFL